MNHRLTVYIPDVVPDDDRATMLDRGYGSHVEPGDNIGVIVIDMTNEFVDDGYANGNPEVGKPAAANIARLMDVAKENDVTGFYSKQAHGDHPAEYGRWGDTTNQGRLELGDHARELTEELSPTEDDVVFEKFKPSLFFDTQLESMLNYQGIDTLVITGMATSGCVRATVIDAFSLNYRILIPQECVADSSQISHEVNLFEMDMKYADVLPMDDILEIIEDSA